MGNPIPVKWLGTYPSWADELAASLDAGLVLSPAECESTFDDEHVRPLRARFGAEYANKLALQARELSSQRRQRVVSTTQKRFPSGSARMT